MSPLVSELWLPGADAFLHALSGGTTSGSRRAHPAEDAAMHRASSSQTPAELLCDIVSCHLNDSLESALLDKQVLVTGWVDWFGKDQIASFSVQALVCTNMTIEDAFYKEQEGSVAEKAKKPDVRYYRCEYDVRKPGAPFAEPCPHIHVLPEGEPRFPLGGPEPANPILDFLEFLALNHSYVVWFRWALSVCDRRRLRGDLQELRNLFDAGFDYRSAQRELVDRLPRMKEVRDVLRQAAYELHPWGLASYVRLPGLWT
ncbi:MAG: hypothetical protein RBU45_24785 [Myxococcota bacterium]|nr:hypothetical protein [Myxococcota bacterium]